MDYKRKVQTVYPEAVCETYNGLLRQLEPTERYIVYQKFDDTKFDQNRRYEVAALGKTPAIAWETAWNVIERNMLRTLEK